MLGLFFLLTLVMLFPLSLNLTRMVPEPTDPLLNAWRMQWNARAFLSGPEAIAHIFDTNIFYPFPLTLAYSEHFLFLSAQALPFLLIADSHLWGLNVSVLLTFVLSGYAMYLLVTAWTGNRWAGLVAGLLFAFSPNRFGRLNNLEVLAVQWIPLTLLALHWTLTRTGRRYVILLLLFFNLQALTNFHFALNLAIACGLMVIVYAALGRILWRPGLWGAAGAAMAVTLLLNWPIVRMYFRFSEIMGAVRTPGVVRVYSAALTDYFTTIPHNLLYGWTFGRWSSGDHQIQPLMPVGLTGLLLVLMGLLAVWFLLKQRHKKITRKTTLSIIIFLVVLIFVFLLLSFGLNEAALGPELAPLLKYSPYFWLYDHVVIFQGIRGAGRNSIMVAAGLAILAGWGVAVLSQGVKRGFKGLTLVLTALILLESWTAPLYGPEIPTGAQVPPVYHWLQAETPADTVILELPYQTSTWRPNPNQRVFDIGVSEFIYEYYSTYHWRQMANGGTGFTPPIYKDFRQWLVTFPDTRSLDVIQQLGIDLVILHQTAYKPDDWQRLMSDLPFYLPAFSQINQIGEALVLHLARPTCQPEPEQVSATLIPTGNIDGLSGGVEVTYHNNGSAAFVANIEQTSQLTFTDGTTQNFTEPLVTPAGQSQSIIVPFQNQNQTDILSGAWLSTLKQTINVTEPEPEGLESAAALPQEASWQPLGLKFAEGLELVAYSINPAIPTPCSHLALALKWAGGQPGDKVTLQLLDPFGRVVVEQAAHPWASPDQETAENILPLPGSLPAGRYGLRIYVHTAAGQERLPVTAAGVTIPTNQIPPLPLLIYPVPPTGYAAEPDGTVFGETIRLVGRQLDQPEVAAGDWLRFRLVWQVEQAVETDLTIFTQLLGPDGQVWGQRDNQPQGGRYSLSWWPPGQPVADDYAFQVSPDAPPGTYRLIAGWYNPATLTRLPTAAGQDFVEIGTVEIREAKKY